MVIFFFILKYVVFFVYWFFFVGNGIINLLSCVLNVLIYINYLVLGFLYILSFCSYISLFFYYEKEKYIYRC